MKKVYMAGTAVFLEEPQSYFEYAVELGKHAGLELLVPYDDRLCSPAEIYLHNVQLLNQAEGILVNLNPFRGTEPDSGTVWEMGYMAARGKRVVGYMAAPDHPDNQLAVRVKRFYGNKDFRLLPGGRLQAEDSMTVENFGQPLNLMLMHSCHRLVSDFPTALLAMEGLLEQQEESQRILAQRNDKV